MGQIYENSFVVNSFHAVDGNTGNVITADAKGKISLSAGQKIVFVSPYSGKNVAVNTIVFDVAADMKIQINDNDMYPLFIAAGDKKGVQYMQVTSFTALTAGSLSFDAMAS